MKYNKENFIAGRIYQKMLDNKGFFYYGINNSIDPYIVILILSIYNPKREIYINKKLKFGYELIINEE